MVKRLLIRYRPSLLFTRTPYPVEYYTESFFWIDVLGTQLSVKNKDLAQFSEKKV
jgi:hypothetical protein